VESFPIRALLPQAPGSPAIEEIATPQCQDGGHPHESGSLLLCITDVKKSKVVNRD